MLRLAPLIGFAFAATLTPGGATTIVAASGSRFGVRKTIAVAAGICVGMGVLMATLAAGLGQVAQTSDRLTLVLRVCGSLYLATLAWRIARQRAPETAETLRPLRFIEGVAVAVLNPKVWALGLAAVSTFSDLGSSPTVLALLLGGTFVVVGACSAAIWCLLGASMSRALTTDRQWAWFNRSLALVLTLSIAQLWL